ncbi:hypothetical protein KXR53_32905 [Inquilinus limosus]|uniref:hypothetical protein n=1 Tax=Inquilinus limosus TaxID=171674 RepID=UPI003F1678D2
MTRSIDADGDAGNGNIAFTSIGGNASSGQAGDLCFVNNGVRLTEPNTDVDDDGCADLLIPDR